VRIESVKGKVLKKIWFTAVARSAELVSNSKNSANSIQNFKNIVYETDTQMASIDARGRKISRYCPFKTLRRDTFEGAQKR
jgi:hypothetical protein